MLFILLSILSSTILVIHFKVFGKKNINVFQAIVVNYLVAFVFGFSFLDAWSQVPLIIEKDWFFQAFLTGFLFISIFYLIAICTQKAGITTTSVANKMSVLIPVLSAVILYNEQLSFFKIIGLFLCVIGLLLVSIKNDGQKLSIKQISLPILLFFSSGFLDSFLNHTQRSLSLNDKTILIPSIFLFAFLFGLLWLLYLFIFQNQKLSKTSILGGISLGISNFFSLHFLILTLNHEWFSAKSAVVFPLNNIGIVIASTLVSIFIFKEDLNRLNKIGIIVSVLAILCISLL